MIDEKAKTERAYAYGFGPRGDGKTDRADTMNYLREDMRDYLEELSPMLAKVHAWVKNIDYFPAHAIDQEISLEIRFPVFSLSEYSRRYDRPDQHTQKDDNS
jgi:hypothetical protein